MTNVSGWMILEDINLLALLAPSLVPFVNYVWGVASLSNIEKVKAFYGGAKFTWLISPYDDIVNLRGAGFVLDDLASPEMVLNLSTYKTPVIQANI